jgi:hypothetical protein
MKRNKPSGKLSPTSLRRIPQRRYGFRLTCFQMNVTRPCSKQTGTEIAEPNTPRIVVFPKNSYQVFFARNELEHADRRIHEFVRQVHSQFVGNAPSLSIKPPQRMHAMAVPYSGLVLVTHPYV